MPTTISPTYKRADKKYYVPIKGTEFFFIHPAPNSLVVEAAKKRVKQQHYKDKNDKRLGILGERSTHQQLYNYEWQIMRCS